VIKAYEGGMRRENKAVEGLNGIELSRYMRRWDVMGYIVWNASPISPCIFPE